MAQSDNVLIIGRDWVRESTGLVGSGETTPFERVQETRPSRKWTATSDTEAWIGGDVGSGVQSNVASVVAHNCDTGCSFRIRLGTDAQLINPTGSPPDVDATGVVYDSGLIDAWPPVAGLGYDGFGTSLGGFPVLSDFADYPPYTLKILGATYTFRYWRLDIESASTNGNGAFSVGRIMIGLSVQLINNAGVGYSIEWADPSELTDTEESFLIRRKRNYRILRLEWPIITKAEALSIVDDFKRIVGTSREILICLFPTGDQSTQYRTTIYGVPIENGPVSNPHYDLYRTSIAVRELPR